jgi:hypothetical protein
MSRSLPLRQPAPSCARHGFRNERNILTLASVLRPKYFYTTSSSNSDVDRYVTVRKSLDPIFNTEGMLETVPDSYSLFLSLFQCLFSILYFLRLEMHKERDHWKDQDVGRGTILKWILER